MNKKGQMGVGSIIMVAIGVIVGSIFLVAVAQSVGTSVDTVDVANQSLAVVVNNTAQYLDYRSISDVVVYNATGNVIVSSANYTVTNNVINPTTGALAVQITPDTNDIYKSAWKVSGTAQPTTYIAEAGGRAMANLVIVFFALAVLALALTPVIKEGMANMG